MGQSNYAILEINTDYAMKEVRIHPTAIVESGVVIGPGSSVWDNVHVRHSTVIGDECIIGEKTYVAYGVNIGSSRADHDPLLNGNGIANVNHRIDRTTPTEGFSTWPIKLPIVKRFLRYGIITPVALSLLDQSDDSEWHVHEPAIVVWTCFQHANRELP